MLVEIVKCSKPNDPLFRWYKMQVHKNFTVCRVQPQHKVPVKVGWNTVFIVHSSDIKYNGKLILKQDISRIHGAKQTLK